MRWHDLGEDDPLPRDEHDRVAPRCREDKGGPLIPTRQGVPAHRLRCSRAAGHPDEHRATQLGGYWTWGGAA